MKRSKKAVICLSIVLFAAAGGVRGELIVDGTLATDYVWRGFDVLGGRPAFQPSVTQIFGRSGLVANAWFSWGLTGRGSSKVTDLDEMDLTLTWSHPLGPVEVTAGLFHLSWFNLPGWPDNSSTTYEALAEVAVVELPFAPTIALNCDFNPEGGDGPYILLSGSRDFATSSEAPLTMTLSAGYMDQEWALDEKENRKAGFSDITLGLHTYIVTGTLVWTTGFTATYVPLEEINPDRFIFSGRLSVSSSYGRR